MTRFTDGYQAMGADIIALMEDISTQDITAEDMQAKIEAFINSAAPKRKSPPTKGMTKTGKGQYQYRAYTIMQAEPGDWHIIQNGEVIDTSFHLVTARELIDKWMDNSE